MKHYLYENKKTRVKKVLLYAFGIFTIIALTIFLIIFFSSHLKKKKEAETIEKKPTSTVFFSNDKSISLELSNSLQLEKNESDYILDLRSNNNLNIFITQKEILENKQLVDVAQTDRDIFLETFTNTSNISEIKEINVGSNQACLYSFQYLDKTINKAFTLHIAWLQINNSYYIFDIEYPLDDSSFYPNIVSDVLLSFKINQQKNEI